tara:strand:- start:6858 stop:7262 length:405 start_codon:yes stop_codon:yes gene_type:complete
VEEDLQGEIKMKWEQIIKRNCGCGKNPCEKYGEIQKGKGQRHFYLEGGKPVQWTGETHKHDDGTLMSGKEHKEGVSKELLHIEELSEKQQKHLGKNTTVIKNKKLSPKQKKIAELTPPEDKIDGGDLAELREKA